MTDDQDPHKVIAFPGNGPPPKPRSRTRRGPVVTQPDVPHNRLKLGPIAYTCPHCQNVCEITGEGLVFRVLDAYCGKCGSLFRFTNPAFSTAAGPRPR